MHSVIDCVVVGYNDASFSEFLERTEMSKDHSGGYRHLLVNSLAFRGQRVKYPELLNATMEAATGVPSRFHVGRMPNLGAITLVSFLRRHDLRAELVNFYNEDKELLRQLLAERPSAVAITTTFYFESQPIREIVDFVRAHSPSTKVIVGGPHVFNICTDHPPILQDVLFKEMGADVYIFDSQGEQTLARVCTELSRGAPDLSSIPNVIHTRDGKKFERGGREVENNDMEANVVDWSTFDPGFLAPTVQTRTARSCAYKCAFCRYPVMAGALNVTSVETVERELRHLHSIGVTHLLFIDDTFNIPKTRFKDICRMMIRNRFGFRWFSYFRCANADAECFDLMAESGCAGVFLGIESGDDRVLKAMNKIATADKYRDGIRRLNERGIITYSSFIIGHPGETEETARNTLAFIDETRPTFYCLETFFFDPKVPIAERAQEFGLSGRAYAWTHAGMDWRRASDLVEEGYRTITGSTVLPLYSFDLWSVAYLMGQGVELDRIKRFLSVAAEMLVQGIGRERPVYPEHEGRLVSIFRAPGLQASGVPSR
ncbi:MAG: PhpK family radical SAM P-methyltransferase [Gemmatimonadota bacterium]